MRNSMSPQSDNPHYDEQTSKTITEGWWEEATFSMGEALRAKADPPAPVAMLIRRSKKEAPKPKIARRGYRRAARTLRRPAADVWSGWARAREQPAAGGRHSTAAVKLKHTAPAIFKNKNKKDK